MATPSERRMIRATWARRRVFGPNALPAEHLVARDDSAAGPTRNDEAEIAGREQPEIVAEEIAFPNHAARIWLAVIGFATSVLALQSAQEFIVPVVLSVILSYAFEPFVRWIVYLRVPRPLAAALVMIGVVGVLGAGVYEIGDQALTVADRLPVAARQLRLELQRQRNAGAQPIEAVNALANELDKSATAAAGSTPPPEGVVRVRVEDSPFDVKGVLWKGWLGAISAATNCALLVLLTYFLMASGDLFNRKIVAILGTSPERRQITREVLDDISKHVQSFLFIQLVTGAVVGLASWGGFVLLGLDNASVWAVAAGVLNTIPYFGPLIVMAGLFIAASLQFGSMAMVVAVLAVSLLITALEGFILRPILIGRAARMNDVAVFVSLLFWGWLWGVIGMLIAVPLMMFVKSVCDHVEGLAPIGVLLGDAGEAPADAP